MNLTVIILAGGLGTRMKSKTPKLLHKILGKTIIERTVDTVLTLSPQKTIVVLNRESEDIKEVLRNYGEGVSIAYQDNPLGTGDAVKSAKNQIQGNEDLLLILNGDTPLIQTETISNYISYFSSQGCNLSLLSFVAKDPSEYGRILRDKNENVIAIVENKDCNEEQRNINEVNSGIYLMDSKAFELVDEIKMNTKKGEYYITDLVGLCVNKGLKVSALKSEHGSELLGINTRKELSDAILILKNRVVTRYMEAGVTFIDPTSVIIEPEVKIEMDTIVYPNVIIEGKSVIGNSTVIYPNSRIIDTIIEEGVTIKDSSVIEASHIKAGATIGPFAHLRPHSIIGEKSKIGNFVEVKKSNIGKNVKASHLTYIGDAEIGEGTNIGAGTITCNYDGKNKHKTIIGENVFVGSDTQFVAPVNVGEGSYIGAGSTITKDVPPYSLAI
ncbi:MAG: bifunctional UDP-N-acetylglucosamine diphosphorylase/glucosamine-1-phosphate N-acetyltransferase GlmU, partial [Thermodesulfovibrionales bacterium]|nr:bifunctional UDP-N-acetylglucosamine diphosphorylase/glucosamine-1-phosphate N-acetyltransferase GlmU [Thermodesulfovibrionales bacterium]